jgi:F-type H+-transporting ATPase subunit delta
MKGTRAAIRYAKAFLKLAQEGKVLEEVVKDAKMVSSLIEESRDLELLLASPLVKAEKKHTILNQIFDGKVNHLTLKLINLLVKQKREVLLHLVCDELINIYNEINRIARVNVTTAVKLDEELKELLLGQLRKAYNLSSIELKETVDPELIGGMVMRIGDQQLDASIRRQLKDIEKELV